MKAVVGSKSGPPDVLQLKEVVKPTPKEDEVLIKVYAATVTAGDVMLRKLHPLLFLFLQLFGLRRKKTPGHELAGVIEKTGIDVKWFKAGDHVFGTTTGLSVGANAEYICLPEKWKSGVLTIKPENISFEEAAALPVGGMTAFFILKKADIQPGQKVLIYGASGSVGSYAVQLVSHHFGGEVTGVCSTGNIALVKSLGADQVIDYTQEDLTQIEQRYDVVFDAVGKLSKEQRKNLQKENTTFLSVRTTTRESKENFQTIKELAQAGKIEAVIDRRYPLDQVAEAHRYVESGHKKGNVVIAVMHEDHQINSEINQ